MLFTATTEIPINEKKMNILSYYIVQRWGNRLDNIRERYLLLKSGEMFSRSFLTGLPSHLIDKTVSRAHL